jgi:hypothetical protein
MIHSWGSCGHHFLPPSFLNSELFDGMRLVIAPKSRKVRFFFRDMLPKIDVKLIFGRNFSHCLRTSSACYQHCNIGEGKVIEGVNPAQIRVTSYKLY